MDITGQEALHKILKGHAWMDYVEPIYWDGKFDKQIDKYLKVSLCITCMDRLHDLERTLPKNMADNSDYPNIEYVLLDYNSQDRLEYWVKTHMMEYIENGTLVYVKTEEPTYYSMTHSRNIAFKVASGDIVNNVDADSYTNEGFATYLNILAHQQPKRAIFGKGKRMLRGRLGFYRREFIELLAGYDEELKGYGHDDHDIMHRAWGLGFNLMWFGGQFYTAVEDHRKHQGSNYQYQSWKYTEKRNKIMSFFNLAAEKFKANEGHHWGKATLIKNFKEEIKI
jgi:predicted glycosyltransferase involved in capsule biosynthesis